MYRENETAISTECATALSDNRVEYHLAICSGVWIIEIITFTRFLRILEFRFYTNV